MFDEARTTLTELPAGMACWSVQAWLHKNLKLWSFYCDLEESLGTLASSREVYDRMIELKISTPQIFLNYAHLLWEGKYFEDAFRVYEKGVAAFKYPHVKDLWQAYLTQFVGRYGKNPTLPFSRSLLSTHSRVRKKGRKWGCCGSGSLRSARLSPVLPAGRSRAR